MKSKITVVLFTSLLLMVVAFHYGYPLLTSDSAAYITLAFNFSMPADRSPFYGFFIRHTSLHTSLWYVLFAQAIILSRLLIQYIKLIFGETLSTFNYLVTLLLIIGCTTVSWTCSYLMPDIFTAILLLSVLLFSATASTNRLEQAVYLLLIFCSAIVHNSNILVAVLFSSIFLLLALYKKRKQHIRNGLVLFSVSVASFLFTCTFNKAYNGNFTLSEGRHMFLMGRLAETGILDQYLAENCHKKNYLLCDFRNDIPPQAISFLWEMPNAPHSTLGWKNCKAEYNAIITDIFSDPKYVKSFCLKSMTATIKQLTQIQAGKPNSVQANYVYDPIDMHFKDELKEYRMSRQLTTDIDTTSFDRFYLLILLVSSIGVLAVFSRIPDRQHLAFIYATIIGYIICNAFVTATFANVLDRLNNRVFWLLPATNIIILCRYWAGKWTSTPRN